MTTRDTAQEETQDEALLGALALVLQRRRQENALVLAVAQELVTAQQELLALLARYDPAQVSRGRQARRIQALLARADAILTRAYRTIDQLVRGTLLTTGTAAVDVSAAAVSRATGIALARLRLPTRAEVRALILRHPVQGATMGEWWRRQRRRARDRFADVLRLGVVRGQSVAEMATALAGETTGGALSRAQAEVLVRTGLQEVASQASFMVYEAGGIETYIWLAAVDTRTCPVCRVRHGVRYAVADVRAPRPPAHWQCVTGETRVLSPTPIRRVYAREHEGLFYVVTTANGRRLTATANHPVLTTAGLTPLERLQVGDELLCDRRGEWRTAAVHGEHDHVIPRIKDLVHAALESGAMLPVVVPLTTPDFHGDAADGEVAVVGTNRRLVHHLETGAAEGEGNGLLDGADPQLPLEPSERSADLLCAWWRTTTHCVVGGRGETPALIGAQALHASPLLCGSAAERNARGPEGPVDGLARDAQPISDPLGAYPAGIEADHVISVERFHGRQMVYNLEVDDGIYIGNGVLTGNCRCTTIPVVPGVPTPAIPDYETWLRGQSVAVQDEVLGRARAARWRAGEVTLAELVRSDGRLGRR